MNNSLESRCEHAIWWLYTTLCHCSLRGHRGRIFKINISSFHCRFSTFVIFTQQRQDIPSIPATHPSPGKGATREDNAHLQVLYRPQGRLLPQGQIRRLPCPLSIQAPASRRGIRPFHQCLHGGRPLCRSRQLEPGSGPKAETEK